MGKWPCIGYSLLVPAAHSHLVTRTICSRRSSTVDCVVLSVVAGPTNIGELGSKAYLDLLSCQVLPYTVAARPLEGGTGPQHS